MFEGVKWSAISHGPVRVIGEYIQRHVKYYILSSAAERWLRMAIAQRAHKEVYCIYALSAVTSRKRQLRGAFVCRFLGKHMTETTFPEKSHAPRRFMGRT